MALPQNDATETRAAAAQASSVSTDAAAAAAERSNGTCSEQPGRARSSPAPNLASPAAALTISGDAPRATSSTTSPAAARRYTTATSTARLKSCGSDATTRPQSRAQCAETTVDGRGCLESEGRAGANLFRICAGSSLGGDERRLRHFDEEAL